MKENYSDVVIVGGGLAGLTAATSLAQAGKKVTIIEKRSLLGGRARTQNKDRFYFNLGPHALYLKGGGISRLRKLGIIRNTHFSGGYAGSGLFLINETKKYPLPVDTMSVLFSKFFSFKEKMEVGRLFGRLNKIDTKDLEDLSLKEWAGHNLRYEKVRDYLFSMVRLCCYATDFAEQSAGAALAQLRIASSGGVIYLDRGWLTLVEALSESAIKAGVNIISRAKVTSIKADSRFSGISLSDGTEHKADAAVLAIEPDCVRKLLGEKITENWPAMTPLRAACFDIALRRLPEPKNQLALGIKQPLYMSVHSSSAMLAPDGGALIHTMKYLKQGNSGEGCQEELEILLDRMQPGWKNEVVEQRFLPNLTVAHAMVTKNGGLSRRPGPATAINNLFIAGDWVGARGMLADAAITSAWDAAWMILQKKDMENNVRTPAMAL